VLPSVILPEPWADVAVISALVMSVLGLAGFILSLLLGIRLAKLRRGYAVLIGRGTGAERASLLELVNRRHADVDALAIAVREVQQAAGVLGERLRHVVSGVSLVRYDAFQEMGGRMSFSAALVDAHGTGLVITTINGRSDSRSYLRLVREGSCDTELSTEEQQALAAALAEAQQRT